MSCYRSAHLKRPSPRKGCSLCMEWPFHSETLLQQSCCCEDQRTEMVLWDLLEAGRSVTFHVPCQWLMFALTSSNSVSIVWIKAPPGQISIQSGTDTRKYSQGLGQYLTSINTSFAMNFPIILGKTSENTAAFSSRHLKHDTFQTHLLPCLGWQSQEAACILRLLRPLGRKGSSQILDRGRD